MKSYVLGFAVNTQGTEVLLIQKNRPTWAAGCWNGVGGHIEAGETPIQAMVREFAEETGLVWDADSWAQLGVMSDQATFEVFVFVASGAIVHARTLTDETVAVHALTGLDQLPLVPDFNTHLERLRAGGWVRS
jgi:8-oxo-dGTP diphosphatase